MAKTNQEKLIEAVAAGDLEAARAITAKMAKSKPKPAKKKTTAKPPAKPARAPEPTPASKLILPASYYQEVEEYVDGVGSYEEVPAARDPWSAPSKKAASGQGGSAVDPITGRVKQYVRRVSMKGQGNTNTFRDSGQGGIDAKFKKANKGADRDSDIPRRDPAKRYKVSCEGCRREFVVYLSEMTAVHEEDMTVRRFYKCDRCIKNAR